MRWTAYLQDMDVAGTPTFTGRVAIKNLEDVRFADQYTGTITQQLDAALTDVPNGIVIAPSSMGAGNPTSVASGQTLIDFRGGLPIIYSGVFSSNPIQFTRDGIKAAAFISSNIGTVATSGAVRLIYSDAIVSRDSNNTKNLPLIQADSTDATAISAANRGAIVSGALVISGALSGCTTGAFSGQLTSSLATGTAPFSITSTTVVPNLNVATLNGVTVSGAPTTGQILTATGVATAGWASGSGYKLENVQYTPNTFISSAGGALFTYSLPANELAVGQVLRIKASGYYQNTSGVVRTYTFTLKAGATTLATTSFVTSNAAVTNTVEWGFEFLVICTAAGSAGTVEAQVQHGMTAQSSLITSVGQTANSSTIAFDTTTLQSLTLNVVQTNDATTGTTGRQWMVERLG